ncbi:type II toxin-antitoxin system RatA family toxin [Aliiglaciecola sp. 3_MG-2023]|uniref:type II toxin-antitoxin system RatA family toxin n=1 Tax=Aliiglaciecola sp. 3_MG-2023 TaxID=3062644 RepID=UPI0026E30421|nr:type II toxin-antitoxin system RatA family toxin [Aliiglaciecola sp. 3_MG-2023]MDO6693572.1 type II toxin-antitoxin system RatA family toxin [Aliiglaciecola sp. 3_MG-2023]
MASVHRSALVGFSAESMFDLVNDVASYPEFLPGCAETKVLEHDKDSMKAAVLIAKAGVKQWFTTLNALDRGKTIEMNLIEGPFSHLSGGWSFTALAEDACKIELKLDFAFSSRLAEMAFGKVFNTLATNMVNAFTARAKEVYL